MAHSTERRKKGEVREKNTRVYCNSFDPVTPCGALKKPTPGEF
jgi:hypothetical protein